MRELKELHFRCGDRVLILTDDGEACSVGWIGEGKDRHIEIQEITGELDLGKCMAWLKDDMDANHWRNEAKKWEQKYNDATMQPDDQS